MRTTTLVPLFAALLTLGGTTARAAAIDPFYAGSYSVVDLGSIAALPPLYGGLTFLDSDTILIGGNANTAAGRIYAVDVVRGAGNHIVSFGAPAVLDDVGEFNDGGVVIGPDGVLFTSRWPVNELGQTLPGGTDESKIINLAAMGVAGSHAAINFVPTGFAGAGQVKLVSWAGGQWYSATLSPDGLGTFNLVGLAQVDLDPIAGGTQVVPGGPEGFVYIAAGNPLFASNAMLISEYSAGLVGAYDLDGNGNPLVSTRRTFVSGLTGAEGAAIDPVTGDFIFSTFGGGNHLVAVHGFNTPVQPPQPPGVPEPATVSLLGVGTLFAIVRRRRKLR